ncbi:MAG: hypothetical protein AAFR47_08385 [Pseudomonadota bacterium]
MRAFILACVALVAISWGANFGLNELGFSAEEQGSSPSVRLD